MVPDYAAQQAAQRTTGAEGNRAVQGLPSALLAPQKHAIDQKHADGVIKPEGPHVQTLDQHQHRQRPRKKRQQGPAQGGHGQRH